MTEPQAATGAMPFLESLGPRGLRRAEPRTSIALAGAGCALAILGVLLVSGDVGSGDGDFNQVPGIILSALVVVAGYAVLARAPRGALTTAGAVAAALGVPPLLFFVTFDQGGLPPYSTEAILFVSTIAWLVSFAIGPGRGRPLFLGAGLIGLWASMLQLTEKVFDAPFGFIGGWFAYAPDTAVIGPGGGSSSSDGFGGQGFGGGSFHMPDPTTIGVLSLATGLAYVLLTRWLDRRGHHGVATPFALAALPALVVGALAMGDDLEQAGTGLLLIAIGLGLAYHGATVGRRATAWVGGASTALGAAVFLSDLSDDGTVAGLLFAAAGIGIVIAAHALGTAISEPDELLTSDPTGPAEPEVEPYAPGWTPPATEAPPGQWNPPAEPPPPPPPPPAEDA